MRMYIHAIYVCAHPYAHNIVNFTSIAVVSVQQQHEEKIFTVKEEDINNKPASSSCDADIPSPIKTVETNNTALPSDSDLKKSQQCSEDGDMELEVDKSAEPSGDGKSVTSDKNAKEYSAVTSQAVTSTEATLPGMYACMHNNNYDIYIEYTYV